MASLTAGLNSSLSNVSSTPSPTPSPTSTSSTGQTLQILLVIPVLFIFVVTFFGFTGSRSERRRKDIKDIRSRTGRRDARMPVTPQFIKQRSIEAMNKETLRCSDIQSQYEPDPDLCIHNGWGKLGDFKQSIAGSISVIQQRFLEQTPDRYSLERLNMLAPRELMRILAVHYPNLDPSWLRQYVRMYEYTRFGRTEVPELAHTKFWKRFVQMIALISRSDNDDDGYR